MKQVISFLTALIVLLTLNLAHSADNSTIPNQQAQTSTIRSQPIADDFTLHRDMPNEVVFFEDFENGAEGWETYDLTNNAVAWHKSDFNVRDGRLLWWCGDTLPGYEEEYIGYENSWLQFLDTPVLDLSDAGDNLRLTFDAYWLMEDPRRVPPPQPYDGWDGWLVMVSTNGGESFDPLQPVSPRYTANRLSSADRWWRAGQWPGWVYHSGEWSAPNDTTPEPSWEQCDFDLSDFRQEEVVFRFVLVSDRTVAAPWNYYLRHSGVFIDNLLIRDADDNVFLLNNADDDPVPEELIPRRGPGFGDHWQLTDASSHSGDWAMWNDDDHFNMMNALDSPPFEVPQGRNTFFRFWVFADLPDAVHAGDNQLKDFYQIYLSDDDGATWTYVTHDYNRPEAGGEAWVLYRPGIPFNGNLDLDLSEYSGETLRLRWLFRTDNDHQEGNGQGLFLDDIEVMAEDRFPRDAGVGNFYLPYPTTVGYRLTNIGVEFHNYGSVDLQSFNAGWGWRSAAYGREYPIRGLSLVSEEMLQYSLTDYINPQVRGWTPTVSGVYTSYVRTIYPEDLNNENDSLGFRMVKVLPANVYELGYDARFIEQAYLFDQGEGAIVRFSPSQVGLDNFAIGALNFTFNGGQEGSKDFELVVFTDNENQPGEEIFTEVVTVPPDSCYPNTMTVPLYMNIEVKDLSGDFWVWVKMLSDDNRPMITGDDSVFIADRFYRFDGENLEPYLASMMVHAIITPVKENISEIAPQSNRLDFGEVSLAAGSRTLPFTIFSTGYSDLEITNVVSHSEHFQVIWEGEQTLSFGKDVTFNIRFVPPDADYYESTISIICNVEESPQIEVYGSGTMNVKENLTQPLTFNLEEAFPNPFNSTTTLRFSLDKPGHTKLSVYDVSGRRVAVLVNENLRAGLHNYTLNADQLSTGVYLIKLESNDRSSVRKAALIK